MGRRMVRRHRTESSWQPVTARRVAATCFAQNASVSSALIRVSRSASRESRRPSSTSRSASGALEVSSFTSASLRSIPNRTHNSSKLSCTFNASIALGESSLHSTNERRSASGKSSSTSRRGAARSVLANPPREFRNQSRVALRRTRFTGHLVGERGDHAMAA